MSWRTQDQILRDRDKRDRDKQRLEHEANTAYWDGPGGGDEYDHDDE